MRALLYALPHRVLGQVLHLVVVPALKAAALELEAEGVHLVPAGGLEVGEEEVVLAAVRKGAVPPPRRRSCC